MRDAVIVDAARTPTGKRNGALAGWHPVDLSAHVLTALAERNGLDPGVVDDVIWGCVSQVGEQGVNVARNAVLAAGWPESVPGTSIDRQCGSSQQAAHFAAAGVISGQYDVAIAGGVEVMTRVPMGSNVAPGPGIPFGPKMIARYEPAGGLVNQGISAERIAQKWGLSREQVDGYAAESHQRAAAAQDRGAFESGLVAVPVAGPDGTDPVLFTADQGIRRGSSVESLGALKPAFDPDGLITAGNSSQISDGAAALLITTSEMAARMGWRPLARFHTFALGGCDPIIMLTAPIPATQKALTRSGLKIDEIGHFEVNEAFAPVPLAWLEELGADAKSLNPLGGAIALGHPLGGSGAQLMTRLVHAMVENGTRYGLQTMCEGGGMANATILELL
jgi:acetyl-CoA acyltransferase